MRNDMMHEDDQEFREWQLAERVAGLDQSWVAYIALRRIKWAIGGPIIRHAARPAVMWLSKVLGTRPTEQELGR